MQLGRRIGPPRQRLTLQLGQFGFGGDTRLYGLFLGSTRQLPVPQRERGRNCQQGGAGDQPKFPAQTQWIIQLMKYLVFLAFVAIIGSLGTALFFMMKNNSNGRSRNNRMARALAMRVGISILLFVCILIAWKLGYIQPTGIPSGQ